MRAVLKAILMMGTIVIGAAAFAQAPQPQQQPSLDLYDQLYLLSKGEAKQLEAMKEQMNEHLRHDQAVAEWWQKVWDGLPQK